MRTQILVALGSCLLAAACSVRTVAQDDEAASDSDEADESGETATDTASETTGVEAESCSCIESIDLVCDVQGRAMALNECDVPNLCGLVDLDNPDPAVVTCILQSLVDQDQPSRFDYVAHVPGGWGDDTYVGTFFILGPGEGIDLECVYPSYDCCSPPPPVATPAFHGIEAPAYFEDCIGKSDSVAAGCIFNGLVKQALVPECG